MRIANILYAFIIFSSLFSIAKADIYKCRDLQGHVLYTSHLDSHSTTTCQLLNPRLGSMKIVKEKLLTDDYPVDSACNNIENDLLLSDEDEKMSIADEYFHP